MNAKNKAGRGNPGMDRTDLDLLAGINDLYDTLDPMPEFLPEVVLFALAAADLDAEVARLVESELAPAGARAAADIEMARRVTFSSDHLTVMIAIESRPAGDFRVDGWAAPGGAMTVELRAGDRLLRTDCDGTGRFSIESVPAGPIQLTLSPTPTSDPSITMPVVTPALQL